MKMPKYIPMRYVRLLGLIAVALYSAVLAWATVVNYCDCRDFGWLGIVICIAAAAQIIKTMIEEGEL